MDRMRRGALGWGWWPDEQPSAEARARTEEALSQRDWRIGAVLSHTCPLKHEPVEVFLMGIDQSSVDKSTETWLDGLEERLDYGRWFCGHFHTDKEIDRMIFMMHVVREWRTANGLAQEPDWNRRE